MAMLNFLLTLHIFGAIAGLGVTFAFPIVGAMARKEGAPVLWFLRLVDTIADRWVVIFAALIIPGTGAGLIITQHISPWESGNRWLLSAIILYTIAFAFSQLVQARNARKAIQMAEGQQFGPAFGALMKKVAMGGQFLTVLLVTIIILMVTKPGSGFIHP
jgi:uncharacterized membrane protein